MSARPMHYEVHYEVVNCISTGYALPASRNIIELDDPPILRLSRLLIGPLFRTIRKDGRPRSTKFFFVNLSIYIAILVCQVFVSGSP